MDRHGIVLVTDQRQRHLAEQLGRRKGTVLLADAVTDRSFSREVIGRADFFVFPTPLEKWLNKYKEIEILKNNLTNKTLIFGGVLPKAWKERWQQEGFAYCDLMEEEEVVQRNAGITAEAVVCEVIGNSPCSVDGQKIVLTGYGRCGRAAARKLLALGAKVTVLARSTQARRLARADGCCAVDFAYGAEEMYAAATVVNTVPAPVVTEGMFARMQKDTLVLDIASAPGGCDREAAEREGIRVIHALGLPGRYTTASSARVLADAIRSKMNPAAVRKEEKTWIYQILPSDMA